MNEQDLRKLIGKVKSGALSRRGFFQQMIGLGLTAPLAAQMLAYSGVAQAQAPSTYKPTRRGGGGPLKLLWWQGATLLNPHFAVGTKDQEGSRIFYEPLAGWDNDGNMIPILAAEVPSIQNGGLAKDGKSVIWKMKKGVTWHDGTPFTADDVIFNWEYASDPAAATVTIGSYKDIKCEKIDSHTVRVLFPKATPFWGDAFCSMPRVLQNASPQNGVGLGKRTRTVWESIFSHLMSLYEPMETVEAAGSEAYSQLKMTSSAVNGWPSCQVTPRFSFQTTLRPSAESPPFSRLGISAARTGCSSPSASHSARGS